MYIRKSIFVDKLINYSDQLFDTSLESIYKKLSYDNNLTDKNELVAWKLGGATRSNRDYFNYDAIFYGKLFSTQIKKYSEVSRFKLKSLRAECEIAVRLKNDIDAYLLNDLKHIDNSEVFDSYCACIEMPDCTFDNLHGNINALISDRCAAGALILGDWHKLSDYSFSDKTNFQLSLSNRIISEGYLDNLLFSPFDLALKFLTESCQRGIKHRKGDIISTGGITPCVSLENNKTYNYSVNSKLEFSFKTEVNEDDSYNIG